MEVKELRAITGMTQTEFANYFHIKIDTLRMWEQHVNRCPDHNLWMMQKIIEFEKDKWPVSKEKSK